MSDDLLYNIALTMIPGVGGITAKKLVAAFGSSRAVFDAPDAKLESILSAGTVKALNRDSILRQAEKELAFAKSENIRILFYTGDDYPQKLNQCDDAPAILFVKGSIGLNNPKTVSIVGTRNASNYGLSLCRKIIEELAEKGHRPLIISGLAYGIDICAHTAALSNGLDTLAVLGTPLNKIYPAQHENIARKIEKQGALVSEYVTGSTVAPGNFISRNRIIAGLADITLVIESAKKGGALLTADIAHSYRREVMACPGRIGDEHSQGCNNLIKAGKASIFDSVDDLVSRMRWSAKPESRQKKIEFVPLSESEQAILNFLKNREPESVDNISRMTGISLSELSAFLLNMEFADMVAVLPGNRYTVK
jgi:DNA processing protein